MQLVQKIIQELQESGTMSKIRRKLLLSINTEASWYRLCEGGIYTTNNAYINTLFKNFTSTRAELQATCKVLVDNISKNRKICGAGIPSTSYHMITYASNSLGYLSNMYIGARSANSSSYASPMKACQPFLNKKIRFTLVPNANNNINYIQTYNNGELGNKIYFGYSAQNGSFPNNCSSPILIFDRSTNGVPEGEGANNIAIYKITIIYNNIVQGDFEACQLTANIPADLASDNKTHQKGEYGMYDSISGKFFGNIRANSYFLEHFDLI